MFIIIALGLTVLLAVLINTRKKFREDCTRALFRPYNFFADVRDQRIISSIHTVILLFVEAGSASLLFSIILFYLKSNVLLEKILLSFGNVSYVNMASSLAWHPEKCFFYIFALLLVKIALITIIIKLASLFIKTRINYTSIFFTVVWALLPFTLLLPVELILFKILVSYGMNIYILTILTVFLLWVLQRILKGIHVIFDVNKIPVYIYSMAFVVLVIGGTLLYYQLTNSTLYYISNAIKQFKASAF